MNIHQSVDTIPMMPPLQKKLYDCIISQKDTSIDELKACLLEGADPNGMEYSAKGNPQLTILLKAVFQIIIMGYQGDKEVDDAYQKLHLLMEFGGNINQMCLMNKDPNEEKKPHMTALSIAVRSGSERLFDTLIDHGADPHSLDEDGVNFLHNIVDVLACNMVTTSQACAIAGKLIKLGVSVDQKKVFKPEDYLVQKLLEKGIKKTEFTVEEHAASQTGCDGLVDFLRTIREHKLLTQMIQSQEDLAKANNALSPMDPIGNTLRL